MLVYLNENVISESAPVCTSNISLSSIVVDNDCNLEPDHIRLDCSVASHGNRPPVLEWRHSMDPDVIIPGDGTTSIHSVHLRPEFRWNGTNFICSIKDLQPPMQRGACGTPNISVECKLAMSCNNCDVNVNIFIKCILEVPPHGKAIKNAPVL